MKKILYHKRLSNYRRVKKVTIEQRKREKDCETFTKKSFVYMISHQQQNESNDSPEMYIQKFFDTKNQIERLSFEVKGSFYVTKEGMRLRVCFHHTLNISIHWLKTVFSPKKSAMLT